ncbi:hypothetical protein Y027_5401 [Burkholderia pseudomallei TSV5]|nr:hypothetical protein Y027_5401 [Burkholderia pseudomallei TSV5]
MTISSTATHSLCSASFRKSSTVSAASSTITSSSRSSFGTLRSPMPSTCADAATSAVKVLAESSSGPGRNTAAIYPCAP